MRDMYLFQVKSPAESKSKDDIYKLLATVPGDEAFKLYDLEDQPLSYREIADRLHVSEGDVRNYLHRVRTRLREILAASVDQRDERRFRNLEKTQ